MKGSCSPVFLLLIIVSHSFLNMCIVNCVTVFVRVILVIAWNVLSLYHDTTLVWGSGSYLSSAAYLENNVCYCTCMIDCIYAFYDTTVIFSLKPARNKGEKCASKKKLQNRLYWHIASRH